MTIQFKDNEIRAKALQYWANYIETGDILESASDCVQRGKLEQINHLLPEQNELVNHLRELALEELKT